jgi:AraC-like DNA-binding protein
VGEQAAAPVAARPPSHAPLAATPFIQRVREATAACLTDGDASVRTVSRRLAVSGRTLQRRLQHRGTTLQEVVADVRRELASSMLAGGEHSVADVSRILGFSAPSAFHRAFKRWTGMTPGEFRRAQRSVPCADAA